MVPETLEEYWIRSSNIFLIVFSIKDKSWSISKELRVCVYSQANPPMPLKEKKKIRNCVTKNWQKRENSQSWHRHKCENSQPWHRHKCENSQLWHSQKWHSQIW